MITRLDLVNILIEDLEDVTCVAEIAALFKFKKWMWILLVRDLDFTFMDEED